MKGVTRIADATCLACGCLCDDIELGVAGDRIVAAERACPIGQPWFIRERPTNAPACRILGMPVSLDAGLARAAQILNAARQPLVVGLAGVTCEAQRAAVALADRLGGCVAADVEKSALSAAMEAVGAVTATLGEARHRADLVIFWCVDPATTHPRHFERYSLEPRGEFVPRGRADRTCVVVDTRRTATADVADDFLQVIPGDAHEALDVLQLVLDGKHELDAREVEIRTGAALRDWERLAARMKTARYGAVFFDRSAGAIGPAGAVSGATGSASAEPTGAAMPRLSAAELLLRVVRDLNRHTRFVGLPLGGAGNAAGAAQVLAWQTGYSGIVDFSEGAPRPLDSIPTADAAIVLACDPIAEVTGAPPGVPRIVLHTADITPPDTVEVAFAVGTAGIDAGGTVFRSDGVALPLRPAIASQFPAPEAVLQLLREAIALVPKS